MAEPVNPDIRWCQRFDNFKKANARLNDAVLLLETSDGLPIAQIEVIKEAMVQRFEYTWELAWNTICDFAKFQGRQEYLSGPRDAIRMGVHLELIDQSDVWMDMLKNRNKMSHTYDQATTDEVVGKIVDCYHAAMGRFEQEMDRRVNLTIIGL